MLPVLPTLPLETIITWRWDNFFFYNKEEEMSYGINIQNKCTSSEGAGEQTHLGTFTISSATSQNVIVGFKPRQIRVYLNVGNSPAAAEGMHGEWGLNEDGTTVQFAHYWYSFHGGGSTLRNFNTSNAIAIGNGTTYQDVANIAVGGTYTSGNSLTSFDVNCTVYTSTETYYYVAVG